MKSTGLFGKNSGRIGGVVYSNYRGVQVVRTYQPKVANPSTQRQVAQRAKFKLVTQVGASLSREIKMSFVPNVQKESPRNAFIKSMLKKTTYSNNQATLPIEDVILTNSSVNAFARLRPTNQQIDGSLLPDAPANTKVRAVFIGYNDGGEISLVGSEEAQQASDGSFLIRNARAPEGFSNLRALVYSYSPEESSGTSYDDYEVLGEEATLNDAIRIFSGRINYSQTANVLVPQNV